MCSCTVGRDHLLHSMQLTAGYQGSSHVLCAQDTPGLTTACAFSWTLPTGGQRITTTLEIQEFTAATDCFKGLNFEPCCYITLSKGVCSAGFDATDFLYLFTWPSLYKNTKGSRCTRDSFWALCTSAMKRWVSWFNTDRYQCAEKGATLLKLLSETAWAGRLLCLHGFISSIAFLEDTHYCFLQVNLHQKCS